MLIGFLATLGIGLLALVLLSAGIGLASEGQILSGVRVGAWRSVAWNAKPPGSTLSSSFHR